VGISWDYPLKTRTSKQPVGEILGYEIIPSHPLKYPRSKQGLIVYLEIPSSNLEVRHLWDPFTERLQVADTTENSMKLMDPLNSHLCRLSSFFIFGDRF
jgi:hypothetical protein